MPDRQKIRKGDRLLCDGWAFGLQEFNAHPCKADEDERTVCGRLHVSVTDDWGIGHLYPVERFRHVNSQIDTNVPTHVTTEPQIFITVQRYIGGQQVHTIREFSLMTYLRAKYPGEALVSEINAMLREVHYDR